VLHVRWGVCTICFCSDIAYALWTYVFSVVVVQWVLARNVDDLLFGWRTWLEHFFCLEINASILVVDFMKGEESSFDDEEN
jgi:hypothetical protein